VKGPSYVCDEIRRDEDPKYVTLFLHWALLGYVDPGAFAGKRLLDFGCGSGASTAILGRMFPETETVGVELEENLLGIARKRAAFYGNEGVSLRHSLSGERLPDDLGSFDFVTLSAVGGRVPRGDAVRSVFTEGYPPEWTAARNLHAAVDRDRPRQRARPRPQRRARALSG
jgi:SAM-dependent methyltransferase